MRALSSWFPLVLVAVMLAWAGPVRAANVPGDYPTIQAALDAGATHILVADGTYHEVLSVTHDVELLPQPPSPWDQPLPFPRVDGMTITLNASMTRVYVRGFHFTGPVVQTGLSAGFNYSTSLEACWLDGGLSTPSSATITVKVFVHNCLVLGNLSAAVYYPAFQDNVVVGGGITAAANGEGLVTGNLVIGPAAVGISTGTGSVNCTIRRNTVRNVQDGIVARLSVVDSNTVTDCGGTAYKTTAPMGTPTQYRYNTARRCGGHGIDIAAGANGTIVGNTVDSTGLSGIHIGSSGIAVPVSGNSVSHTLGHGIWAEGTAGNLTFNRVLFAGGDGIRAQDPAESNVVGRGVGRGLVAPSARHNTCYLNGDAGLELDGTATDSITHNIAYENDGPGLRWTGTGTPFRGCNDWYLNSGGATSGVAPGATDLAVDPLFCDVAVDVVALSSVSPLANAAGCGRIGALGVGCTLPVAVGPDGPALPTGLAARPLPASGGVVFSWAGAASEGRLEVYDIGGALRWSSPIGAGTATLRWDGTDAAGAPLAPGTYFARRTAGQRTETARVVIIR